MRTKLLLKLVYWIRLKFTFLILFLCGIQLQSYSQQDSPIFRDNFEREQLGEVWQSSPSWSIKDGSAHNYIDGYGGILRSSEYFGNTAYVIETSAKGFTNNYWREFQITFGQESLSSDNMYILRYTPNSGGQLTLAKSFDNESFPEPLDEIIIYPDLAPENWYKFKIEKYRNGIIKVYLDKGAGYSSVPLLEATDLSYPELGHFGWQENTQTAAESFYVDWIEVREPVNTDGEIEKPIEDNLITQVSASSGNSYKVAKLNVGEKTYTDRAYTITAVPDYLQGASFIQTANNDKLDTNSTLLTAFIKKDAIIYIGYDPRAAVLPAWLQDWEKTGDLISSTDPGSSYYEVYAKKLHSGQVYPRPFIVGGNNASPAEGAKMNYLVVAVETPVTTRLEAEDAVLFGAEVDNKHAGYSGTGFVDFINPNNDYIEWSVQIDVPGSYNLGITYANGKITPRFLNFTVDSTEVNIFPFLTTMNWENWAFQNLPAVYLTRGTHTIRATAVSNSGPNIDFLNLTYVSPENNAVPYKNNIPTIAAKVARTESNSAETTLPNLLHAFPNPFEGSINIAYSLKEKTPVNLTLYDSQGAKVNVLVDKPQEAGNYNVIYDGSALHKGLYIYKLTTGNKVKAVKVVKK